jgi:hypothetical protein
MSVFVDKRAWAYVGSDQWKQKELAFVQTKTSVTAIDKPSGIKITQYQVTPETRGKVKRWLTAELAARVRGFITHDIPKEEIATNDDTE